MPCRPLAFVVLAAVTAGAASCGPSVDLATTFNVTSVFTGYYDVVVVNGLNKLVPSISFKLKNVGPVPVNEVNIVAAFWVNGDDGPLQDYDLPGIGKDAVPSGAESAPILIRSDIGYTLEQPRAELFTHSMFRDGTVKLFAKRGGKIVPLGEFKIDRRIIPHLTQPAGRP